MQILMLDQKIKSLSAEVKTMNAGTVRVLGSFTGNSTFYF